MKRIYKYGFGLLLSFLSLSLVFQSCTKDFEEINTDPYGVTDEQMGADYKIVGEPFKQALQNIYSFDPVWVFQLQQNLIGDVYSGYMMPPTPFRGNINNMTYFLVDGWNQFPWSVAYDKVMAPMAAVDRKADPDFPDFSAWAKIVRVEAMHRLSDIYGPVIYTHYGQVNDDGSISYDCQKDVYDAFFKDLDEAVEVLSQYANDGSVQRFANFDLVYGGDYGKWVKFANSLRLRLAIRISEVDPDRAQTEAEKAISNTFGVIEDNADNFMVKSDAGFSHPLNTINNAWNDIRMNANMESILKGYKDPRMEKYFQPATGEGYAGDYKGIREGIVIESKDEYVNFSKLVDFGDVQLMTAAEIWFLRAEGALRGWNMGGTPKDLYETGVRTSFDQHGCAGVDEYLADDVSKPIDYEDPVHPDNSETAVETATIKWDDGADFDTKLDKIITQKWIAMYPDGQEAWSEFRRTGYPKQFPLIINNSGGTIPDGTFIKRVNFVEPEYQTNPQGVEEAKKCLKGPDTGGTPLWWDVNGD
jgi:hypothetical protein